MRAPARGGRRGFTMVELLVVLTIIAMLASVVAAALYAADQKSREAATKATIAKLHTIVMQIYDSYRTRRVPISTSGMAPTAAAAGRLVALRDIMRMEMPDHFYDIFDPQTPWNASPAHGTPFPYNWGSVPRPSVSQAYLDRYQAQTPTEDYQSAECLYLVVTTLGGEDARRQFRDVEVGDVDQDGWPEFLDGWGNPIYFLRGAPGFTESDMQRNVTVAQLPFISWTAPAVVANKTAAATEDHDPFDPRKIDPAAWRLVPLIISAGRDHIFDISFVFQPYYAGSPYAEALGLPNDMLSLSPSGAYPANGHIDHYDNLHNHSVEASQ